MDVVIICVGLFCLCAGIQIGVALAGLPPDRDDEESE